MAKPTNKKKKPMTLEDFAAAVHEDYLTIKKHMATKEDIRDVRAEMTSMRVATGAALRDVRDDVQRLNEIMVSKADLAETIRRELDASPYAKEADIKDLAKRLLRVEEKLGLKPSHRAA